MRRLSAILLLALFSSSLLSSAFSLPSESGLASCCRRDGKHHCSMPADSATEKSGLGFEAQARCPLYLPIVLSTGGFSKALITPVVSLNVPDSGHAIGVQSSQPRSFILRASAHHKRGPPFTSLHS